MHHFLSGGESHKVYELRTVVVFELEAYPEPKALSKQEMKALVHRFGDTVKVAKHIGASQSFVWDRANKKQ